MLSQKISQAIHSATFFLLVSITILFLSMNPGMFFPKRFGAFDLARYKVFLFYIFFTLIFLFVIPVITNRVFFRENLRELGLVAPESRKKAIFGTIVALALFALPIYSFTHEAHFKMQYAHNLEITRLFMIMPLFPLYYFAEEFFFRGFLFLTLWKKIRWHSFWITDVIFTLSHLGKPGMEILLCIPGSLIFNCLTLYTRSIYPAIFVHTSIGVFVIGWVNLG